MLTRIRNAQAVNKKTVSIPFSSPKYNLAKTLLKQGFIEDIKKRKRPKRIVIRLKYTSEGKPIIKDIKPISKPSRQVYLKKKDLYTPREGYGILILSTPQGMMTTKEAEKIGTGGKAVCEVW